RRYQPIDQVVHGRKMVFYIHARDLTVRRMTTQPSSAGKGQLPQRSSELELLAEAEELVAAGAARWVDAEWVTAESVAPGISLGFVVKPGICRSAAHVTDRYPLADGGSACGICHRRVAEATRQENESEAG